MKKFTALLLSLCTLFIIASCQSNETATTPTPQRSEQAHIHSFEDATCQTPKTCSSCGLTEGERVDHNYVAGECSYCSDYNASYCPKLYFTGDMTKMTSKADERDINFEYRSKDQRVTGAAKIKIQGTSSLRYEKKNYTIKLYENSEYSKKLKIDVGWGKESKYCLKANWIDKTHSRNVVTAKLAGEVQAKYNLFTDAPNNGAVDGFPVEVYINDDFHGLYTMNIPKDSWMFNMDEENPNHIVICGEDWFQTVLFNEVPKDFSGWSVEVGQQNNATLKKIQRLVKFVKESSDKEFKADFEKYLNLDSTLNYYVLMNYCWMPDNAGKNMLLATYDGNVWYPTLYDLDTTWGTSYNGTYLYSYKNKFVSLGGSLLWARMEKLFKKEIAARYFELRSTLLDTKYVYDKFNSFYNSIPQEVLNRETAKWNTATTSIPGYPISQIEEFLDKYILRLDAKYNEWK